MTNDLIAKQARLNDSSRLAWDRYAVHRERVMSLIPEAQTQQRTLGLLGAGNCNDVDLGALTKRFEQLHLVDVDTATCRTALRRHPSEVRELCHVHRADLSGVLELLPNWSETPPQAAQLREIPPQAAKRIGKNLPGPFDVVLSAGVVSQLVWSCMTELGLEHPALRAVALTAMMTHVCMAATLTRPGGTLILVVDTIARHPDVFAALGDRLSTTELLAHFERRTECLPATELEVVLAALKQAFGNAEIRLATPWLWTIAEHRSSLVYAVTVRGHDSTGAI